MVVVVSSVVVIVVSSVVVVVGAGEGVVGVDGTIGGTVGAGGPMGPSGPRPPEGPVAPCGPSPPSRKCAAGLRVAIMQSLPETLRVDIAEGPVGQHNWMCGWGDPVARPLSVTGSGCRCGYRGDTFVSDWVPTVGCSR